MEKLAELLTEMTRSLVDHPDHVRVVIRPAVGDAQPLTFLVYVASGDLGQAIGKEGRLANAIRLIVKANARRLDIGRVLVEFQHCQQPSEAPKLAQDCPDGKPEVTL